MGCSWVGFGGLGPENVRSALDDDDVVVGGVVPLLFPFGWDAYGK